MKDGLTRRDWLRRSGMLLGGATLIGPSTITGASASQRRNRSPIRMMFNENPYGPSRTARMTMTKAFEESSLYKHFGASVELKEMLAKKEGVTPEQIVIGSGSREILNVTALHYLGDGGEIVANYPGFETLNRYAENLGAIVNRVQVKDDMSPNIPALKKAVNNNTKLINICNPNNPTGVAIGADTLEVFCRKMESKCLVFVDEAYNEYVMDKKYRSMVSLVKQGLNVMVTRTFSKIHALAGIRVGYGIAKPEIVSKLEPLITGTVNILGLRAAMASLQDEAFQKMSRSKNLEAKEMVYEVLEQTGKEYAISEGNFIFFRTGIPINDFQAKMEKKGILVGRPFPPFDKWCRLSMAKPKEMKKFTTSFKEVMA